MRLLSLAALLLCTTTTHAQWEMQDPHVTADLRGIDYVGNGVAWASGSHGTILRTEDMGFVWQLCATPPDAKDLDFRGVQAFDNNTAIVMASGPGDKSRLYKTTDGCQTWKEVFRNPDEKGFFDSLLRVTGKQLFLLGDPVNGKFAMFTSRDTGVTWYIADDPGLETPAGESAFAASNASLSHLGPFLLFGTGGQSAKVYLSGSHCDNASGVCSMSWTNHDTTLAHGQSSSGVFALGGRASADQTGKSRTLLVAVGGRYDMPEQTSGNAACSGDGGLTWSTPATSPAGYRSAVAFQTSKLRWITVGPNGTDVSTDDGRNWHPLTPGPGDAPDADKNWNALSLPFVVGPHGRIGILRDAAVLPAHK